MILISLMVFVFVFGVVGLAFILQSLARPVTVTDPAGIKKTSREIIVEEKKRGLT